MFRVNESACKNILECKEENMSNCEIGSLIKKEREEKKISREKLCNGICTQTMLFKIEDNQSDTDKLFVDILLQRLGKSPDKLEVIMSYGEYNKIRARKIIEELMLKKRFNRAKYLLENIYVILTINYSFIKCTIIEQEPTSCMKKKSWKMHYCGWKKLLILLCQVG